MELDNTTVLAVRGAAHAMRGMADTLSLWGRDALRAVESAAKAWERLAAEKLKEHERNARKEE